MIFIRPWLLLLLFLPFVFKFVRRHQTPASPWIKWVDKRLLPALLVAGEKGGRFSLWRKGLIALWMLLVIAAAGPSFQKLPVPVNHSLPNTVIIFDLSPSMQGAALANARIKLHDLLTELKGNRVGLVLYADKGYVALPLTEDRTILRQLIPTLDISVLPSAERNLAGAFETADKLIEQAGGKGRILYLTAGGVEAKGVRSAHPVGVLGLDDAAVSGAIKSLGAYHKKTTDATDIFALLKATEPDTTLQFEGDERADEWADLAPFLVLILLPFFALTFRRGFLFGLVFLFAFPTQAAFFKRADQVAYEQHTHAVADYRAGAYEKAIEGFQNHSYNRGNALAHAGKIQEAIAAYEEALKENPADEDARFNKEYLEKQLPPEEQNQQTQDQKSGDNKQDQQNQAAQDKPQESEQEQSEENTTPENQQQQPEEQQAEPDKDAESEAEAKPNPKEQAEQQMPTEVNEENREQSPFNQEEQQMLNRLVADPYRVLRYRILQQARQK